jgi:rubrerythrin
MDIVILISGAMGLVALIVFFVMAQALANISSNLKRSTSILNDWAKDTGYGMVYRCDVCKKTFEGKKPTCPHCNAVNKY